MPNKWIQHVKEFADKHKLKYGEALKHPQCKASYATISGSGGGASKIREKSLEEEMKESGEELRRLNKDKRIYQGEAFVYRQLFPHNVTNELQQRMVLNNRIEAYHRLLAEGYEIDLDNPAHVARVIARADN